MPIEVTSTTDSGEVVTAAMGDKQQAGTETEVSDAQKEAAENGQDTVEAGAEGSEGGTKEPSKETKAREDGDEGDEDGTGDDEPEKIAAEDDDKPQKKSRNKNRVNRLANKLTRAEQEAEFWKAEALKAKQSAESDQGEKEVATSEKSSKPDADDFEDHSDYIEALTDWKVEQKLQANNAKMREESIKKNHQTRVATFREKVEEFAQDHEDFDDIVGAVEVPMTDTVREAILTSDNGPAVIYELAKDVEKFEKICKMPAIASAKAIGAIEARLSSDSVETKQASKPNVKKAPKPIEPVKTTSAVATKKSINDPDISQLEFERLRNEQEKVRKAHMWA